MTTIYTLSEFQKKVKDFFENRTKHLLISGRTGIGKSFMIKKIIKDKNLTPFVFVKDIDVSVYANGRNYDYHKTSAQDSLYIYIQLYNHRDKILILDDFSYSNKRSIMNLITSAISDGIVKWNTKYLPKVRLDNSQEKIQLPREFNFTGKILFIDYSLRYALPKLLPYVEYINLDFKSDYIISSIENGEFYDDRLNDSKIKQKVLSELQNPYNRFNGRPKEINFSL